MLFSFDGKCLVNISCLIMSEFLYDTYKYNFNLDDAKSFCSK